MWQKGRRLQRKEQKAKQTNFNHLEFTLVNQMLDDLSIQMVCLSTSVKMAIASFAFSNKVLNTKLETKILNPEIFLKKLIYIVLHDIIRMSL